MVSNAANFVLDANAQAAMEIGIAALFNVAASRVQAALSLHTSGVRRLKLRRHLSATSVQVGFTVLVDSGDASLAHAEAVLVNTPLDVIGTLVSESLVGMVGDGVYDLDVVGISKVVAESPSSVVGSIFSSTSQMFASSEESAAGVTSTLPVDDGTPGTSGEGTPTATMAMIGIVSLTGVGLFIVACVLYLVRRRYMRASPAARRAGADRARSRTLDDAGLCPGPMNVQVDDNPPIESPPEFSSDGSSGDPGYLEGATATAIGSPTQQELGIAFLGVGFLDCATMIERVEHNDFDEGDESIPGLEDLRPQMTPTRADNPPTLSGRHVVPQMRASAPRRRNEHSVV